MLERPMSAFDVSSLYTRCSCASRSEARPELAFSGNSAALRAGCRLADPVEVDRAALGVALGFLALPRRTRKASQEMRAALVPYLTAVAS